MAKLLPGPLASEVRNSIGEVTFQVNRGVQIARKRPITPAHMTPAGLAVKNGMRRSIAAWNAMKFRDTRSLYWPMFMLGKKKSTAVSSWHSAVRLFQGSEEQLATLPFEDPTMRYEYIGIIRSGSRIFVQAKYTGPRPWTVEMIFGSFRNGDGLYKDGEARPGPVNVAGFIVPDPSLSYTAIIAPVTNTYIQKDWRLGEGFMVEIPPQQEAQDGKG